ncbi:hypothetical protein BC830DRAFT_1170365 [Chytriomyces sp. MP71]|nr:hypothetical protein BC830DRAFT_1170365 [Chytriomyces sp. MP71]
MSTSTVTARPTSVFEQGSDKLNVPLVAPVAGSIVVGERGSLSALVRRGLRSRTLAQLKSKVLTRLREHVARSHSTAALKQQLAAATRALEDEKRRALLVTLKHNALVEKIQKRSHRIAGHQVTWFSGRFSKEDATVALFLALLAIALCWTLVATPSLRWILRELASLPLSAY